MHEPQELTPSADWLLAFIDDTGHETCAGSHDYYGLGGCAVMGYDYEGLKARWRAVRALITGNADAPLHAASLTRNPDHLAALSEFFLDRAFARFAVTSTRNTAFRVDMHTAAPVMGILKQQVCRVAALTTCRTVALVFESSQRADPVLMKHFGELELEENGRALPVEHCIMPKSAAEPGLEIADFIINAAGSQTRRHLRGTSGFARDYEAVFHQLPRPFGQFSLITEVDGDREGRSASVQGVRLA
jgi:hypothetical protein